MKNLSDSEILSGIQSGRENSVLEYLYDKIFPQVKKMVFKYGGKEEEAYDAFQEGIIKFYHYAKTGKLSSDNNICGFIYTVTKNHYIDNLRRNNKSVQIEEADITDLSESDNQLGKLITEENENKITELFSMLGEVCKQLLLLYYYNEMSMKDIAVKMGFSSEDVAKTKNYKCKQRLIELTKKHPGIKLMLKNE